MPAIRAFRRLAGRDHLAEPRPDARALPRLPETFKFSRLAAPVQTETNEGAARLASRALLEGSRSSVRSCSTKGTLRPSSFLVVPAPSRITFARKSTCFLLPLEREDFALGHPV